MVIPLAFTAKFRLLLIAPLIFALFLTKSLGAFFSLFLGMTVFFSLRGKLEKKGIIILSGLFVILGLLLLARIATPKQYIHPAFSAVMRLSYWQQALRIIRAYPLTGIGLGNFDIPLSRYAHNSYLEIWAEMGILGLISFIWLAGATLKSGIKKIKEQEYACLVTSAIVFLTHNLIDFTFFLPEVSLIWWVILGLAF
jgi:O-antigen ligase